MSSNINNNKNDNSNIYWVLPLWEALDSVLNLLQIVELSVHQSHANWGSILKKWFLWTWKFLSYWCKFRQLSFPKPSPQRHVSWQEMIIETLAMIILHYIYSWKTISEAPNVRKGAGWVSSTCSTTGSLPAGITAGRGQESWTEVIEKEAIWL